MITYKDIQKNKEINAMIEQGNQVLKTLGYTEHSKKHALKVAEYAAEILKITGAASAKTKTKDQYGCQLRFSGTRTEPNCG